MNKFIKRLIDFLTLENRNDEVNSVIGYLTVLFINEDASWEEVINSLIVFDNTIMNLFEKELDYDKLKTYSIILNNCYNFINAENNISFVNDPPFDNERVANIKDYKVYILARRTLINEYEKNKGVGW